ncbi:MAG: class I SAM-dependent methyltransferase family protein [Candidatus Micrarchaeota archaeon]
MKVRKTDAQRIKNELIDNDNLDRNYRTEAVGDFVFFPIKREIVGFIEREMVKIARKPTSLKEVLAGVLGDEEIEKIVTSFDVVGGVAIVEIPVELEGKKGDIGEALMLVHKNVRTVAAKRGPMEGEFRVRKLEVIAGERNTETRYRESGCEFVFDIAKVYFSPRLSFERERIAGLIKGNERVLVMFAGVGPFPIVVARRNSGVEIAAVELNPAAFEYLVGNIKLNRMERTITPVCGDVREVIPELFVGWADRVLMPLPRGAEGFLDVALCGAKKGGVLHVYCFARVGEDGEKADEIARMIGKFGGKAKVLNIRTVRPFAPHVDQIVVDVEVC